MELNKELNQAYNKDKKAYEKVKRFEVDIKILKEDLKREQRAKEDAQIRKIRAHEDKNKVAEKMADDDIKDINKNIQDIKAKVEKLEKIINKNKEKVDSYINELNQDPEFQAEMKSILEKKYNRLMKKAVKEKEQIDLIIDVCEKHPSLEMNLKGMIRAAENDTKIKEQMKKMDDDLKKLDPIKDKAKIDQINNIEIPSLASLRTQNVKKSDMNEKAFMDFCQKNSIAIDRESLKMLVTEKSFSHDKGTGEIQALKSLKKISKGYNKQIKNFEKCIGKIPGATIDRPKTEGNQEQSQGKEERENSTSATKGTQENNLPDKKYKWYEFGKKYNAWKEKKRVQKEAKNGKTLNEGQEQKQKKEKSSSKFRNAYKYDIVKDYIDNQMNEMYKEATKETRQESKQKETEGNER